MWSAGASPSVAARHGGSDLRPFPRGAGGDGIPLTTQCGQRGPPPQSLRDSSPAGGAISDLLPPQSGGRAPRSAEVSAGLPLSRCATAPPRGERFSTFPPRCGGERIGGGSADFVTGRGLWLDAVSGGLPLSRCATAPQPLVMVGQAAIAHFVVAEARFPTLARSEAPPLPQWAVRRERGEMAIPRSASGTVSGGLPLSRCATAPPQAGGAIFDLSPAVRGEDGGIARVIVPAQPQTLACQVRVDRQQGASPSVAGARQLPLGGSDFRPFPRGAGGERIGRVRSLLRGASRCGGGRRRAS